MTDDAADVQPRPLCDYVVPVAHERADRWGDWCWACDKEWPCKPVLLATIDDLQARLRQAEADRDEWRRKAFRLFPDEDGESGESWESAFINADMDRIQAEEEASRLRAELDWKGRRLAELAEYNPSPDAIAHAGPLFESPWFTIIYDGALQFEWEGAGHYLEIEVHTDGEWQILHMTDNERAALSAAPSPAPDDHIERCGCPYQHCDACGWSEPEGHDHACPLVSSIELAGGAGPATGGTPE